MNKKIFSKFLVLALAVGLFGVVAATRVLAQTPTTTDVDNTVPVITVGFADDSDNDNPTVVGNDSTWTVTATDANLNGYYAISCSTDSIEAQPNAAGSCAGDTLATSELTASGAQATMTRQARAEDPESITYYAFVCDYDAASLCTSSTE
ncbi:MAG: hypothetical protein V1880_02235, partial [Patescibacteria group bacterium]